MGTQETAVGHHLNEESPLADSYRAAGAPLERYFGVLLPAQFGDVAAEYRIARQTCALIDTNFRAVFAMAGADRVRYLNAVTTGNVRDLRAGQGTVGLLLNAQGHIQAELETFAFEDRLLVLGHKMVREQTFAMLDKFIIMDDVSLSDETAESGTVAIEGPEAARVVRSLTGIDLLALPMLGHAEALVKTAAGEIPCRVIRRSLYGYPGAELLARVDAVAALWSACDAAVREQGGGPIGYRVLNALRLEAGVAWFGSDFDARQIPHEAALEGTHISFTKGCYTGQEIVERVRSRGHVNRRLTGLKFSGSVAPGSGSALLAGAVEAGHVTSAAFSPLLGAPIGLGYVRREYGAPGTTLRCGEISADVIELPVSGALSGALPGAV